MKRWKLAVFMMVFLALAGAIAFTAGLKLNVAESARAQSLSEKPVFNQGIGYYVQTGGQLNWLGYPILERNTIRDQCLPVSKSDFKIFTYGIDYSKLPSGLPPHLDGFCVVLFESQYNLDNPDFLSREMQDRKGPYAVHFIPVAGYDQPVYELTCDLLNDVKKKSGMPIIWGLRIKDGGNGVPPIVYWFTFKDAGENK